MTTRATKTAVMLAIVAGLAVWRGGPARAGSEGAGGIVDVDLAALVSRADLVYDRPVARSEEGMPLGNGRMGSLVWTVPSALRLQINRVDVFSSNCATNSFPERNTEYCGSCAFVDLEFPGFGEAVFDEDQTSQKLSCHDGLITVKGRDVEVRALAWHEQDVMALEVTDRRSAPGAIRLNLRMIRPAVVRTMSHVARSRLDDRNGRIVLTQSFEEDAYYCGSAAAVATSGREVEVRRTQDDALSLDIKPGQGTFTVLIASAASFNRKQRLGDDVLQQLDTAASRGFAALFDANRAWWHDFWKQSFVCLHSTDGTADEIERNYTYYLYVMASSSRGKFPAKFNGMLWTTGGDIRRWGSLFWGANQSCLYNALLPTNRLELIEPMFAMYSGMAESCALAARQQWGSEGIYLPETVAFDGLPRLPDEIAAEMQGLYLLRKPWAERSPAFLKYARTKLPFSSRWNWIGAGKWESGRWTYQDRGGGPFGPVSHILSAGAKIAFMYWLRYEYTMDQAWLRDRAYPMLRGVAEFYRHFPNVAKGADGTYHIHHVNSNEPVWGGQDTDEELASMRGIFPVVIRASEILNVDAEMRPIWREFLDHLAPFAQREGEPPVWAKGRGPAVKGNPNGLPDHNTMPMWVFDLCTLENKDAGTMRIANATYDAYFPRGVDAGTRIGVLSKLGITAAMLGRAEHVRHLLPNQINTRETKVLANRMDAREGAQTTNVERLGRVADALHHALCQSVPAGPGEPPVIRVFPALPREWDAAFTLQARGAFLVSASTTGGKIAFVQIESQAGGECRLRPPWPGAVVTLHRDSREAEDRSGDVLTFPTRKGEVVVVVPQGMKPPTVRLPWGRREN